MLSLSGSGWAHNENVLYHKLDNYRTQLQNDIDVLVSQNSLDAVEHYQALLNQYPVMVLRRNADVGIKEGEIQFATTIEVSVMLMLRNKKEFF